VKAALLYAALLAALVTACDDTSEDPADGLRGPADLPESARARLTALSPAKLPAPPEDPTNRYRDDARAAELGKQLFFDKRFSGPLLDESHNGDPGTLGLQGEAGKVACASCHVPEAGFLDVRSPRAQISLGSSWTRRRAPSLLDVGQATFLMWDGRHDAAFSQPFTPIEDAFELNSSRLFVAQQLRRHYRRAYEAIFGAMPSLDRYPALTPEEAGCTALPDDPLVTHHHCKRPGGDDPEVTRVVVNAAKAIQAFTRTLHCGPSRFDRFMDGDATALTEEERQGALLFVGKGQCDGCHAGPFFTDQRFHNIGVDPDFAFFIGSFPDPGAAEGVAAMRRDVLNAKGDFSDGYDDRWDRLPEDTSSMLGAFRTPSLRCVSRRPSFMHTGQFRALEDVVIFFTIGGSPEGGGYPGTSENAPRDFTSEERAALVAFLRALDGDGPSAEAMAAPTLPP
jgi:cytochrome c peroxidase